jgi:hypothetical protein
MFSQKALLLAHDAHFGIHKMLRSIPKTWPMGLKFIRRTCLAGSLEFLTLSIS